MINLCEEEFRHLIDNLENIANIDFIFSQSLR